MTEGTLDGAPLYRQRERAGWVFAVGRSLRRFIARKRLGAIGLAIVFFFMILAAFAGPLGRYDPDEIFDRANSNFMTNPSVADLAKDSNIGSPRIVDQFMAPRGSHWFGTDKFGRDIYARVVHGSRLSLMVGLGASFLTVGMGLLVGVTSAYYLGWYDLLVQRLVDALQAFPALVLLLLIVQIAEPSARNTVIALGVIGIPIGTRLIRAATLGVRQTDYILAARTIGASDARLMLRHVLPNIASVVLIAFSIGVGAFILFEATISFLGVGPRNVVSWGKMIQEGRGAMDLHPELTIFAGGAIVTLVVGFNFLGDALRDVLDPRLRGT